MLKIINCCMVCMLSFCSTYACTLWGSIGTSVQGGGLLIAKNRDWNKSSKTALKIFVSKKGIKYLAMYALGKNSGVKGGINEYGLAVFSASVSCIKMEDRKTEIKGKLRKILGECKSVNDYIKNQKTYLSGKAEFLLIGDSKELVSVEVTPDARVHIERCRNGTLTHTNHYLYEDFLNFNKIEQKSSTLRYDRMSEMVNAKQPINLQDMISYSEDRKHGLDNSVWRDGSFESDVKTLMNMSIYVPQNGPPILYAKIALNAWFKKRGELVLDEQFWKQSGFIELRK